jgi:MFS family permease
MDRFKSPASVGVAEAFIVMAFLYALSMLFGALIVRVPPEGWRPNGWEPTRYAKPMMTNANVAVDVAWKTPQFWCLWVVLCMNVTAGIGLLGQASKMCSDMFGVSAVVGGGFAGLLSIFNMGGRFFWSSVSDYIGRKTVYCIYFVLGAILYCVVPWTQTIQSKPLFVAATAIIITMYGGGFATVPAYLRDLFGTHQVAAIHGRLITAWSVAALLGPSLVNYISTAKIDAGVPKAEAYGSTMYLMAGLLMIGLIANLLVRPVDQKHHLTASAAG